MRPPWANRFLVYLFPMKHGQFKLVAVSVSDTCWTPTLFGNFWTCLGHATWRVQFFFYRSQGGPHKGTRVFHTHKRVRDHIYALMCFEDKSVAIRYGMQALRDLIPVKKMTFAIDLT